jgi:hypothetical protein
MPGWLPSGIGMDAMMGQLSASAQPITAGATTGAVGTSSDDQAFNQWLQQMPWGLNPVDLSQFVWWLQQNDPGMAATYQVMPGPFGLMMLLGLANMPEHRATMRRYWQTHVQQQPAAPKPATGGTNTGVSGSGPADPSQAKVQAPFDSKYFNNPSYHGNNYGDRRPEGTYWGGWDWHQGQDYGVPSGTPLSFPFAGRVTKTGYDPNGYGNYVTIEFGDQGVTLTYAHLDSVGVREGQTITPGQQVGVSGSTGISTGGHLLVVEQNAQGQPLDPRALMTAMFSGATLSSLETAGVAQTGTLAPAGTSFGYIITPDGHTLYEGTPDRAYYDMISQAYQQRFGTVPPYSMVMAMRSAGVTNTSQLAAVVSNWPSDIPGVSFGQRDNIYNTANGIATKQWGRPIPDSLVKRLAQLGLTSADDIQLWFASHTPNDMPPADYQQIYDAANPSIMNQYGEPPSPDYIGYLWGQASQPTGSTTAPSTSQSVSPQLPGQYQAPPGKAQ